MRSFEKMWLVFCKTHGKTHLREKPSKIKENLAIRLNATVRREMGSDINGACGQLRRSHLNPSNS